MTTKASNARGRDNGRRGGTGARPDLVTHNARDDPPPGEEKAAPHDLAAERIVLGAIMLDGSVADDVTEHLSSDAFYDPRHATIYRAIIAAYGAGDPTEHTALAQRLSDDGDLHRVGGGGYRYECLAAVPTTANAVFYAKVVAKKAHRRRALEATVRLQLALQAGHADAARHALDELTRIASGPEKKSEFADLMVKGGAFVLDIPEVTPALWGQGTDILWAEGEALMICGPSGVGKTTLTGQLLRALLGLRSKVLDWPVQPVSRVLYLAMDRPSQIQRSLNRIFNQHERAVLDDRVVFWKGPPPYDLAGRPETLLEMARAVGADVVIVDSLKDAAIGLSEDPVGASYNRARQAVLADGRQMLELHHVTKRGNAGAAPNTLADVYGSAHIVNGAGSVIMLWGDAGDPIVDLKHLKQPSNDVGPLKILHEGATGDSSVWDGADLLEAIRRCVTTGMTANEAATVMYSKDKPSNAEVEKARRRLERMTKQGLLTSCGGSRGPGNVARWFVAAPASWGAQDSNYDADEAA